MNIERVILRMKKFEGNVRHLYQDSLGYVTVGAGHLLSSPEAGFKLGFYFKDTTVLAAPENISVEWNTVKTAPKGKVARFYKDYTKLDLAQETVDKILVEDVDAMLAGIGKRLLSFPTLPPTVQEALLDIAFNCGVGGLMKFSHMLAAIEKKDWRAASEASHRVGIGEARNKEIAGLFLFVNTTA